MVVEAVDVDGVGGGCEGFCYILYAPLLAGCVYKIYHSRVE